MSGNTFASIIHAARKRMRHSNDPVHDLGHAERTAQYVEYLTLEMHVDAEKKKSIVIAAWWHDVARTLTDKPSFIWMPFVDDLFSAAMLWWHTMRTGSASRTTAFAVCLIACKSIGTGAFLTKILIRKRDRVIVDLLKDADTMDVFTVDRFAKVLILSESSRIYRFGYRIHCRWYCLLRNIKMKTDAARRYVLELLRHFLEWIKQPFIHAWHVRHFGKSWTKKTLHRIERSVRQLTHDVASATL